MVENDAVNVTAYVRIYKDPTGVLWHNFLKSVFLCLLSRKAAENIEVTILKRRLVWSGSKIRERHAISTPFFSLCISQMLSGRYV